jgi:mono/diheme cytochrome c family protein
MLRIHVVSILTLLSGCLGPGESPKRPVIVLEDTDTGNEGDGNGGDAQDTADTGQVMETGLDLDPRVREILALEGDVTWGEKFYEDTCAHCHGPGLGGTVNVDLNLKDRILDIDKVQIVEAMLYGVKDPEETYQVGSMPVLVGLSDQRMADILAYLWDETDLDRQERDR